MKKNDVNCLINLCSCFVMDLTFYILSIFTNNRRVRGVVTLPMSCYIFQKSLHVE